MAANPCSCPSPYFYLSYQLSQNYNSSKVNPVHLPRSTNPNHRERSFFPFIINPSNIINLQLIANLTPTCSLLTSIVTTGSIFCRFPFFYFTSRNYSTTTIRGGSSSANANLVILTIVQKLNYSGYYPVLLFHPS